jgi:hypothetical protein
MSSTQPGREAVTTPTAHTCPLPPGRKSPAFGRKTPGCPRCDELLAGAAPRDRFAPKAPPAPGTKHSADCSPPGRGPGFRRTAGCPRCAELDAGAPAREAHAGIDAIRRAGEAEAQQLEAIRTHDCAASGCGPVCTANQW